MKIPAGKSLHVTGGTGFVGSNIVKVAVEEYGATVSPPCADGGSTP